MIIEVTGTNTRNKGAELMLVAVREYFERHHPEVKLAVDPSFGTYDDRVKYNLWFKPLITRWGRSKIAMEVMPPVFRQSLGIVRDEEIGAVVDAAGFAFGDQHPAERSILFAKDMQAARRAGKKVIMLPQALGPFENPAIRDSFARIVDATDRIYARDRISFEHARKAVGNDERIGLSPDFTNLVKPVRLTDPGISRRACIVPNQRMIEKAKSKQEADAYLPMLNHCVAAVKEAGLSPVILIHGKNDVPLAQALQQASAEPLEVIHESDPVRIKQELGASFLVIASRFHALVSALSQGVPAIGTSWSHKYEMLFGDYAFEEFLLPVGSEKDRVFDLVGQAAGSQRPELLNRLQANGDRLVAESRRMWDEVETILFEKKNN